MPRQTCLYALISGAHTPVELHAAAPTEQETGKALAADMLVRLKSRDVPLPDLRPPRLPLVCEQLGQTEEGNIFGYWLTPSEYSLDTLIGLQAVRKTDRWLSILDRDGRTSGDEVLCLMGQAKSIDRAVAILAAAIGQEALHCSYQRSDSPWIREPKLCETIVSDLQAWAAEDVPEVRRMRNYGNRVLYRTPFTMTQRPSNDTKGDFLDHIAARIAHCLEHYRPVLLHRTDTVPSDLVASLIDIARNERVCA